MENKTIYVVNHYGNWDGDFRDIVAFSTYEDAKAEYDLQVEDAKENLADYGAALEIDEDETCYTFYMDGEYDEYNETIELLTLTLK